MLSENPHQGDVISSYLCGKSLGMLQAPDFIQRAEEMRAFTKGAWVAIHFQFIRNTLLAMPRWITALLNDTWVGVLWVRLLPASLVWSVYELTST